MYLVQQSLTEHKEKEFGSTNTMIDEKSKKNNYFDHFQSNWKCVIVVCHLLMFISSQRFHRPSDSHRFTPESSAHLLRGL